MKKRGCTAELFFALLFLLIVVIGCKTQEKAENDASALSGDAIVEIKQGCEYGNGSICTESCCYSEGYCDDQKFSYRECDISQGQWKDADYKDSNCLAQCSKLGNKISADKEEASQYLAEQKNSASSNESAEQNKTLCAEGWKCVEKNYRAYQYTNCSWFSIGHCVYGCTNGTCKLAPICKSNSLKCDNDKVVKCNEDGSEWEKNESCGYQCQEGACIGKNEAVPITNNTNSTNTSNTPNSGNTNSTNTAQEHNFLSDNCISVINFNYAPAGNNLSQEYFTLKNSCSYQIDMGGWTAKDNSTHVYTFPSFNLDNTAQVTIVTGSGSNTPATLYWGRGSAVWNNNGDVLYLNTSNGTSVLIYSYP